MQVYECGLGKGGVGDRDARPLDDGGEEGHDETPRREEDAKNNTAHLFFRFFSGVPFLLPRSRTRRVET